MNLRYVASSHPGIYIPFTMDNKRLPGEVWTDTSMSIRRFHYYHATENDSKTLARFVEYDLSKLNSRIVEHLKQHGYL